jgi:hypothetical protein
MSRPLTLTAALAWTVLLRNGTMALPAWARESEWRLNDAIDRYGAPQESVRDIDLMRAK